ncbi:unnamed protein product, partial [marine sediment metagenome]
MSINLKNSSTVTGNTLMTGLQNSTGATLHVKQNSTLSDRFALLVQTKNGGGDYSSSSGFYADDGDAMELRLANGGSNKVLISSDTSTGSYLKGGNTTFGRSITVGSDATASITLQASGTTFLQMFKSSSSSFINTGTSGGTVFFGAPATNVTNINVQGTGTFQTISNATSDTDKFLVSDGGEIKYRTGAEVRSDIGAGTGSGNVTTSGLTAGRVSFATSGTNIEDAGNFTYNNSTQILDVNGLIQGAALSSENTRVSTSQQFPVGHYSSGEVVWEMDSTWSDKQLQDYFDSSGVSWVDVADAPGGWCIYVDGGVSVGGAYNSGFPFIPVETDSADGDYY